MCRQIRALAVPVALLLGPMALTDVVAQENVYSGGAVEGTQVKTNRDLFGKGEGAYAKLGSSELTVQLAPGDSDLFVYEFDAECYLINAGVNDYVSVQARLNDAVGFSSSFLQPQNFLIAWLICRYSDGDTQTKLKPMFRDIATLCHVKLAWDAMALCDHFPNGSRCYIFGIKAQDQTARYGKLRGLTLAGIYNDQTEELPKDIFQEFMGRLSQRGYPHQLLLTPNPPDENHWLAQEFPEDNSQPGRHYYGVPIYENAHNLAPDTIRALEEVYPPAHPKHRSAVLGKRGLNVLGEPVYKGAFVRTLHEQSCAFNPVLPLDEAIDFGKHHPCIVWRQTSELGQIRYLGGIIGQGMYLEDFLPLVLQYRREWFPNPVELRTCCDPAGAADNSHGVRSNGLLVLQAHGLVPRYDKNSNAPDVRLAMIERSAGHMRRRTPQGEAFVIHPERWLRASSEALVPWKFLADGFEAGYVWDEHFVSVGSKQIRKPKKDGWFEHGQNCHEYLELNFGLTPYKPKRAVTVAPPPPMVFPGDHGWMA